MRVRLLLAPALAALVLTPGLAGAAAPAPQITDPANDANAVNVTVVNHPATSGEPFYGNNPTPVGSQPFADVLSVTWTQTTVTVKKKKKVTGFTVTAVLSAPPVAPDGRGVVYRMLSDVKGDHAKYLGPVYYSRASDAPAGAQSALRDNLGAANRLTPLLLPKIVGSTMTWTVPIKAIPKEFQLKTAVTNLYFEVRELETFPMPLPSQVPAGLGGATGLAVPVWDNGKSTASFVIG